MKNLPSDLPDGYQELLAELKHRIKAAQGRAGLAVNKELIVLYWQIGNRILDLQEKKGWGSKVIEQLSSDLQKEFAGVQGFSLRNMQYMRKFAEQYPEEQIVQQVVAQLPWSHNVTLLDKFSDKETRIWYAQKAIENGWSRNILIHQIESKLHSREASALTNFTTTLPSPQSELAQKVLKDPYIFDFLSLGPEALEADLERGLIEHMKKFLLELGSGFSFVGSQFKLEVGGQDYYLDLLFYHLRLRCYVVIELKIGEFIPEYAGKMNFYLAAVDDLLKHVDDQPTIIMCKTANNVVTRYALRDAERPIGVAEYKVTEALPDQLKKDLPSPDEIKDEFQAGAVSLLDEFAKEHLEFINNNGLLLETALLLLACLKDETNIVHFNEPQRMALHFNKRTKQVYLHDFMLDKYVILDKDKIRHATNEEKNELRKAESGASEQEGSTASSETIVDAEIVDIEKQMIETEKFRSWAVEFEARHKVYRDADLDKSDFIAAIAEASELWKKECEDFLAKNGDIGSCVRGEGINIRYLPTAEKKVERKNNN